MNRFRVVNLERGSGNREHAFRVVQTAAELDVKSPALVRVGDNPNPVSVGRLLEHRHAIVGIAHEALAARIV